MPLLAGILSALALLLAVATIVGVIAPSLFRNRKTGQVPKRLSVLVWGCIAVLVAMILAGSQVPPPPAPPAAAGTPEAASARAAPPG
ncbi:hypothetical protein [Azotobacter chroococcum]|uniref:hypothetical protein n=1 Tax=Azotobacter chroococcum TaxID=353 RepID=UPI000B5FFBA9|nr:hypothetical protein [Azotobacter chroococcum]ASL26932.1 hypothetical protein ACG10_12000 [Azotobacter chroococcum]